MSSLDIHQYRLLKALKSDLSEKHTINSLETAVLHSQELHKLVGQRTRERRGIVTVSDYNPNHVPGVLKKHNIHPNGKRRTVFSPGNSDYCQAQYFQMGITGMVAEDVVHENTYAYIERRGIVDAIRAAIEITVLCPDCVWIQEDIKDCFNTVPTDVAEIALPPRTWRYIQQVRHRHRELTGLTTGLPQGHPIAASVINIILNTILIQIRQAYNGLVTVIVYSDDLTIIGPRETVKKVRAEIQATLARYGMKLNPQKSRIARPVQGQTITLLGYEIEWLTPHSRPLIRPRGKAYCRLEESLATALDLNHAEAIKRGWLNAYHLTNDPKHLPRVKLAIGNGMTRWRDSPHRTSGPIHGGNR